MLGLPLASLATEFFETEFRAGTDLGWNLGFGRGGSLTIGLSPEVGIRLILRRAGELLQTIGGGEEPGPGRIITVPPGKAYVSVLFRVSLAASGAGGFSQGLFGVQGGISTDHTFLLAQHCCFESSTPIRDAIVSTFSRFVIPWAEDSAARIAPLDLSEYEFFGNLAFNVTATAGFGGVLLGGRSKGELGRSFSSPVGSAFVRVRPSFSAGAKLSVGYEHQDAFRIVVSAPDPDRLELFVFKMNDQRLTASLGFKAQIKIGASVGLESRVDELVEAGAAKLFSGVADFPLRDRLIGTLKSRLLSAPEQLDQFVEDTEINIKGALRKIERLKVEASVSTERISEHTTLLSYEFDRSSGLAGWAAAMRGDFREAITHPGVRLGEDSMVQDSLTQRTGMKFSLFGVVNASSLDEFVRQSQIVYEGSGVFRIRFTSAHRTESSLFGHNKAVELLFTATAEATEAGVVSDADVRLRISTTDSSNRSGAAQTVGALALLLQNTSDPGIVNRLRSALNANPDLSVSVVCTVTPAAYRRLRFTAFRTMNRPFNLPHTEDALNYIAFVRAVDAIYDHSGFRAEGYPNLVDKFSDWAHYNVTVNDQEGSNRAPNRRNSGGPGWPRDWRAADVEPGLRPLMRTYLIAAQQFMNFCEDLSVLGTDLDDAATEQRFEELLESVEDLVKSDGSGFPLFFTKPVLAALISQMSAKLERLDAVETPRQFRIELEFV